MTAWAALNSVGIAVVAGIVFLLLRQVGYLLERISPIGARGTSVGPRVGENISWILPAIAASDKPKLLVFLSSECSICHAVRAGALRLAKSWKRDSEILLIYDCSTAQEETVFERVDGGVLLKRDMGLRQSLGITFVPYAAVADPEGLIVSKGLVNDISHLESLLELEKSKRRVEIRAISSASRDPEQLNRYDSTSSSVES